MIYREDWSSARGKLVVATATLSACYEPPLSDRFRQQPWAFRPWHSTSQFTLEQRLRGAPETFRWARVTNELRAEHARRPATPPATAAAHRPPSLSVGLFGEHVEPTSACYKASANPSLQRTTTGRSPGCRR